MTDQDNRPAPEARRGCVRKDGPRRQSKPQVAGQLFVQTKKIEAPKRQWVRMSIDVDATAVVKKEGITHIVRAKPKSRKKKEI